MEPGYRLVRGYMWPDYDTHCAEVVFDTFDQDGIFAVELTQKHVGKTRGVIQAGGNCGVWAMRFAQHFEHVYTYEPDPRNFRALQHNVSGLDNIHIRPMALGEEHTWIYMYAPEPANCGALAINPNSVDPTDPGASAMTRIDSEAFVSPIDLIYLDLEGFENQAIRGAIQTIDKYHPVIAFEDKGLSDKYGYPQGDLEIYLATVHRYRVVARRNRDVFMVYDG